MAIINAAEILTHRYPEVFGKRAPIENAAEALSYLGLNEFTTETELQNEIIINAENVLKGLSEIIAGSDFQSLTISLAIVRVVATDDSPQISGLMEKIEAAIDTIRKPDIKSIFEENLRELGHEVD